jgi:hypothetical protein
MERSSGSPFILRGKGRGRSCMTVELWRWRSPWKLGGGGGVSEEEGGEAACGCVGALMAP